jgi:hypothetical protein
VRDVAILARILAVAGLLSYCFAPWCSSFPFNIWDDAVSWTALDLLRESARTTWRLSPVPPIFAYDPACRPAVESEILLVFWASVPGLGMLIVLLPKWYRRLRVLAATGLLSSAVTLGLATGNFWSWERDVPFFANPALLIPVVLGAIVATILTLSWPSWARSNLRDPCTIAPLGILSACFAFFVLTTGRFDWGALAVIVLALSTFWLECLAWARAVESDEHADTAPPTPALPPLRGGRE